MQTVQRSPSYMAESTRGNLNNATIIVRKRQFLSGRMEAGFPVRDIPPLSSILSLLFFPGGLATPRRIGRICGPVADWEDR